VRSEEGDGGREMWVEGWGYAMAGFEWVDVVRIDGDDLTWFDGGYTAFWELDRGVEMIVGECVLGGEIFCEIG